MELPSDATVKQKDVVCTEKGFRALSSTDPSKQTQLEGAKLKEQLEHQAPLLDNIIGASESLEAVSTTMRKRKVGPKAPNPLSSRKKKDLPPTGRLSKKELAAQEAAKTEKDRGKKRVREEEEREHDEEIEEQPKRAMPTEVVGTKDGLSSAHPEKDVNTATKVGGENDGAQKKRKRKRRKKGPEDGEEAGNAAAGSEDED